MFSAFKKFGKLGALASSVARAWSPLALWPNGISTAGMWISPSTLPASFNDSTGTTPVATPGTVADSANPVGLALDIRAGTPVLGPELVVNGDASNGTTGIVEANATVTASGGQFTAVGTIDSYVGLSFSAMTTVIGATYKLSINYIGGTSAPNQQYVNLGSTLSGVDAAQVHLSSTPGVNTYYFRAVSTTTYIYVTFLAVTGQTSIFSAISVREIPGNHMLQASTTARPLESARVNLLTDSGGTWPRAWGTATITSGANDPDGGATAFQIDMPAAYTGRNKTIPGGLAGKPLLASLYIKADVAGTVRFFDGTGGSFDTTLNVTTQWQRLAANSAIKVDAESIEVGIYRNDAGQLSKVYVWHPQLEVNTTTTPYQRVTTDSDYDATGVTPFQIYDGTDDGMATASFAAGTLIDGMDCMIPIRRAGNTGSEICGLIMQPLASSEYFGVADPGSSSSATGSPGCGTPTYWVDGVQLAGGTSVTRGTLHAALTAGDWHILEVRNLDLSTWTAIDFGNYGSGYNFNGARGDIMLFPSQADATERDRARQYLADLYGVTLA